MTVVSSLKCSLKVGLYMTGIFSAPELLVAVLELTFSSAKIQEGFLLMIS